MNNKIMRRPVFSIWQVSYFNGDQGTIFCYFR
jgi:hypothetical protein